MYATWVRFDDATRAEYRESAAAFLATLAPAGVALGGIDLQRLAGAGLLANGDDRHGRANRARTMPRPASRRLQRQRLQGNPLNVDRFYGSSVRGR